MIPLLILLAITASGLLLARGYWRARAEERAIAERVRRYAGRDDSTEPTGI